MDPTEPFREDFDYRYAYPVVDYADSRELVEMKLQAVEMLSEDMRHLSNTRIAPVVQLLSIVRVEMPRMLLDVVGWDVESSYCFSQNILNAATTRLVGYPLSILNECCPIAKRNYLCLIFSTPALNLLCNMLTNPMDEIVALITDGEMDQITQIATIEAAYDEVFRESAPNFPYPYTLIQAYGI
jgi:hypothetical protein